MARKSKTQPPQEHRHRELWELEEVWQEYLSRKSKVDLLEMASRVRRNRAENPGASLFSGMKVNNLVVGGWPVMQAFNLVTQQEEGYLAFDSEEVYRFVLSKIEDIEWERFHSIVYQVGEQQAVRTSLAQAKLLKSEEPFKRMRSELAAANPALYKLLEEEGELEYP